MPNTVSSTSVKQYIDTAQSLGVNTSAVLESCGLNSCSLNSNKLEDTNARITLEVFEQLLLQLIEKSGDPHFGLHCSKFINPSTYSSLGLISLSSTTLHDALELVPTYESLVGDMGTTQLHAEGPNWLLSWHCKVTHPLVRRHLIEAVLSSWHSYGMQILGLANSQENIDHNGLLDVYLEHDCHGELAPYMEVFNCDPSFGMAGNGLVLSATALQIPLPQANTALQESLLHYADKELAGLKTSAKTTPLVKRLIEELLPKGCADKTTIAGHLETSPRSLQRRLQSENTSFQAVLQQVRRGLAEQWLSSAASFEEISLQLGFTETRSFFRYFKQAFGITAGDYRRGKKETILVDDNTAESQSESVSNNIK